MFKGDGLDYYDCLPHSLLSVSKTSPPLFFFEVKGSYKALCGPILTKQATKPGNAHIE